MSKKRSLEALNEDDDDGKIEKENEPKSQRVSKNENSSSAVDNMKKWNLKIISWNVAGIRAFIKKDGLSILENEKPDIMCFQEMKCASKKLPQEFRNLKHDYFVYDFPAKQEGYSGVSLVSRLKPLTVKMGIGDYIHDYEGRSITAEYENFYLVTAYVPNAGRKLVTLDKRLDWEEKMKKYLTNLDKEKPVVYCGDLNVAHEEIDLANPGSNKRNAGFTQEERDSLTDLLKQGFVDTFRHLHPDLVGQYTFWTYMMNARTKNVGWRLDYFLLSKRLMANLRDSLILSSVKGSDHCPISLLLDISSGQTSQGQNDEHCPT